jgi:hypothetical protein
MNLLYVVTYITRKMTSYAMGHLKKYLNGLHKPQTIRSTYCRKWSRWTCIILRIYLYIYIYIKNEADFPVTIIEIKLLISCAFYVYDTYTQYVELCDSFYYGTGTHILYWILRTAECVTQLINLFFIVNYTENKNSNILTYEEKFGWEFRNIIKSFVITFGKERTAKEEERQHGK